MSSFETPRVSVLIPAYRAELTIAASVRSALAQTVEDIEVLVVDDGSPTPVSTALEEIGDARLRIFRLSRNRGVSAARNVALTHARAAIIGQLDADDLWDRDHLERLLLAFEDPSVGLVYSDVKVKGHPDGLDRWIGEQGASAQRRGVIEPSTHPIGSLRELYRGNVIPGQGVLMRTAAVRAVRGYPERVSIGEEYVLYVRLMRAGSRFAYLESTTATYHWPQAERGVTFNVRRVARANVAIFMRFLIADPACPTLWRSLGKAVMSFLRTHLAPLAPIMRELRRRQTA
jgi:glycosyltransferase involved in cell wall biosynthesis